MFKIQKILLVALQRSIGQWKAASSHPPIGRRSLIMQIFFLLTFMVVACTCSFIISSHSAHFYNFFSQDFLDKLAELAALSLVEALNRATSISSPIVSSFLPPNHSSLSAHLHAFFPQDCVGRLARCCKDCWTGSCIISGSPAQRNFILFPQLLFPSFLLLYNHTFPLVPWPPIPFPHRGEIVKCARSRMTLVPTPTPTMLMWGLLGTL